MRRFRIVAALILAGLAWSQLDALRLLHAAKLSRQASVSSAQIEGRFLAARLVKYGELTLPEAVGVTGHIDEVSTVVRGWALGAAGQVPVMVFLIDDAGRISNRSTEVVPRPDVAIAAGQTKANASGYNIPIPPDHQCKYQLGLLLDDLTTAKMRLPSCVR